MAEKVTNDFATVLAQAITNVGTSLTVADEPPSDLTTGNFRVRIENADANGNPTGVNVEYLNVTALGNPTSIWTVTRQAENADRFPAVAHGAGSVVTHVLTSGGLTALVGASGGGEGITQEDLDAAIAAHGADTTAVHGITNTAQLATLAAMDAADLAESLARQSADAALDTRVDALEAGGGGGNEIVFTDPGDPDPDPGDYQEGDIWIEVLT